MSAVHALGQGLAAVAVGAVAGLLAVYMSSSAPHTARLHPASPEVTAKVVPAAKSVAYDLNTRCGIGAARIGNRYFEAIRPLRGTSGGTPAGWGYPYQAGRMTFVSATEVVFTDTAGHRVVFRAHRAPAKSRHGCS